MAKQLSFMCDGCDNHVAEWDVTLKDGEKVQWCARCVAFGKLLTRTLTPREVHDGDGSTQDVQI